VKLLPQTLADSPELAAVAVLDTALRVAVCAMSTAWPTLHTDPLECDRLRIRLEFLDRAAGLRRAIRRYRRAVADIRRTDPDQLF
jgi:hypothetical protein